MEAERQSAAVRYDVLMLGLAKSFKKSSHYPEIMTEITLAGCLFILPGLLLFRSEIMDMKIQGETYLVGVHRINYPAG